MQVRDADHRTELFQQIKTGPVVDQGTPVTAAQAGSCCLWVSSANPIVGVCEVAILPIVVANEVSAQFAAFDAPR